MGRIHSTRRGWRQARIWRVLSLWKVCMRRDGIHCVWRNVQRLLRRALHPAMRPDSLMSSRTRRLARGRLSTRNGIGIREVVAAGRRSAAVRRHGERDKDVSQGSAIYALTRPKVQKTATGGEISSSPLKHGNETSPPLFSRRFRGTLSSATELSTSRGCSLTFSSRRRQLLIGHGRVTCIDGQRS